MEGIGRGSRDGYSSGDRINGEDDVNEEYEDYSKLRYNMSMKRKRLQTRYIEHKYKEKSFTYDIHLAAAGLMQ